MAQTQARQQIVGDLQMKISDDVRKTMMRTMNLVRDNDEHLQLALAGALSAVLGVAVLLEKSKYVKQQVSGGGELSKEDALLLAALMVGRACEDNYGAIFDRALDDYRTLRALEAGRG